METLQISFVTEQEPDYWQKSMQQADLTSLWKNKEDCSLQVSLKGLETLFEARLIQI